MKITGIKVRQVEVPLIEPFARGYYAFSKRYRVGGNG